MSEGLTEAERDAAVQGLTEAALNFAGRPKSNRKRKDIVTDMDIDELDVVDGEKPNEKKGRSKRVSKKAAEFDIKVALCNEIRKHPEIYQITHKDYANKQAKDAIWVNISKEISQNLGSQISVADCKKYWTALKESTR